MGVINTASNFGAGLTNNEILGIMQREAASRAEFQKRVLEQLAYQSSVLHDIATTLKAMQEAGPR